MAPYIATISEKKPTRGNLQVSLSYEDYKVFRTILGQLSWVTYHVRPDITFMVNMAARSVPYPTHEHMNVLCKAIKIVKSSPLHGLHYGKLGTNLELWMHQDSSFNPAHGAMVSMITESDPPEDKLANVAILMWFSTQIRRTCRSTPGAELLTTSAALDSSDWLLVFLIELGILKVTHDELPKVVSVTDARSVSTTCATAKFPKEKNLLVDLSRLRDRQDSGMCKILWVRTLLMLADSLTKLKPDADPALAKAMSGQAVLTSSFTEGEGRQVTDTPLDTSDIVHERRESRCMRSLLVFSNFLTSWSSL